MKIILEVNRDSEKINSVSTKPLDQNYMKRMLDYYADFDYYEVEFNLADCKKIAMQLVEVKDQ